MRTIRTKIYKFDELTPEAQQNAINKHEVFTDFIYDDAKNTVDEFCKQFDVTTGVNSWLDFGFHNEDNATEILTGIRLRTYIINNFDHILHKGKYYGKLTDTYKNGLKIPISKDHPIGKRHVKRYSKVIFERCCNLTGVCYDMDILEPLYTFIDNPNNSDTLEDIFENCFNNLRESVENEHEYRNSDEGRKEDILSQDLEYTKNGQQFN